MIEKNTHQCKLQWYKDSFWVYAILEARYSDPAGNPFYNWNVPAKTCLGHRSARLTGANGRGPTVIENQRSLVAWEKRTKDQPTTQILVGTFQLIVPFNQQLPAPAAHFESYYRGSNFKMTKICEESTRRVFWSFRRMTKCGKRSQNARGLKTRFNSAF